MHLTGKIAAIYGGGGTSGGAAARAFARDGARVFLAGRSLAKLDAVASDIAAAGGVAETVMVDALDEESVGIHADAVAAKAGGIDIMFNAVGIPHIQATPLAELSYELFAHPVTSYTRTIFLTAKAVAPHMARRGSGVILTAAAQKPMRQLHDRQPIIQQFG